jgi:hypothetical protein
MGENWNEAIVKSFKDALEGFRRRTEENQETPVTTVGSPCRHSNPLLHQNEAGMIIVQPRRLDLKS